MSKVVINPIAPASNNTVLLHMYMDTIVLLYSIAFICSILLDLFSSHYGYRSKISHLGYDLKMVCEAMDCLA